jgi:hypothetical protein
MIRMQSRRCRRGHSYARSRRSALLGLGLVTFRQRRVLSLCPGSSRQAHQLWSWAGTCLTSRRVVSGASRPARSRIRSAAVSASFIPCLFNRRPDAASPRVRAPEGGWAKAARAASWSCGRTADAPTSRACATAPRSPTARVRRRGGVAGLAGAAEAAGAKTAAFSPGRSNKPIVIRNVRWRLS